MRGVAGGAWAPAPDPPSRRVPAITASPRDRPFMPNLLERGSDGELEGAEVLALPTIHLDAIVDTDGTEGREPTHPASGVRTEISRDELPQPVDVADVGEASQTG